MTTLEREEAITVSGSESKRFLFALWEGGGNVPPTLAVAKRLMARGHRVRVISDPCNRAEVESMGASFSSWTRAPRREDRSPAQDVLKDWEAKSPPQLIARLRDHVFVGPALAYAQDLLEEFNREPSDLIAVNDMLFGAMMAAEKLGVPSAILSPNISLYPLPGAPAFGPGFMPATGPLGRLRDNLVSGLARRIVGKGTRKFNEARRSLGLSPIEHPMEQLPRMHRTLLLTSRSFDFPTTKAPENVIYAGPELGDPEWTESWTSPWPAGDRRPLVLVGFSTTFQNQGGALSRVVEALSRCQVRAVVTVGPGLRDAMLPHAPNVHVCASAPHSVLLREASAVISHMGHGTTIRSLATGVPIVCMPMGRDQNDNAARVVYHGAGVRLKPSATSPQIREAVQQVLTQPQFRQRAQALGRRIAEDAANSQAVPLLEELAREARVRTPRA